MTYLLTIWLFWTPAEAVLVEYEAASCSAALHEVMAVAAGDGVTQYQVLGCQRVQEVGTVKDLTMDEIYLDEVIRLMESGQYGYSDACDAAWPSLELRAEVEAIEHQRRNEAA